MAEFMGDKGLVTCEDGFFLCVSLVGFLLEDLFILFITGYRGIAILVVYIFGFIG